jgi:Lantibiotic dehydratase, C terminus./Lantibiotic dehydratase, N terminus.
MLKIFPYILARYAALPFSTLANSHLTGVPAYTKKADQLQATFLQQKNALCDLLFTAISQQTDHIERQRLLQLKRDIFNDKMTFLPAISGNDQLLEALQVYHDTCIQKQQLQQEWEATFNAHLRQFRQQLQTFTQQELLRKGILLSSPVLYSQLDSFAAADPSTFRNRELKNEYSLLRYLSRMAAKTSPFSTFTYTGIASPDETQMHFRQPAVHQQIHSGIRLNNALFTYIRTLMIHHPVLSDILEVRLNGTASLREEQLCFLINYFNVEAFQRLPARNLPLWLYHFLRQEQQSFTLAALLNILSEQLPDTDRQSIKAFVLKLAGSGFLELGIGCSGVDPAWDSALSDFLQPHIHHPAIASLYQLLQTLAAQKAAYSAAVSHQRQILLQETAALLNQCFTSLQQEAGLPAFVTAAEPNPAAFEMNQFSPRHFAPQDIFYEDATTATHEHLPAAALSAFIEKADCLLSLLQPADALQEERIRMRNFFLQHYGPDHGENISDFYRAYFLHEKKAALASQQGQGRRPLKVMDIPAALQLTLEPAQVSMHVQGSVPAASTAARGLFVQFYNELQEGKPVLHGVINAPLPGMGKVAGRFLHLFDPAVTNTFLEWNTALHPAKMLMELNDGSIFNANIHPPLLPYEIGMPGGSNNYPPPRRIPLRDVQVRYNPETDLLALYHSSGTEIYAYDLCLESFYNRSHFYQLLAHFNTDHRLPLRQLIAAADQRHAQDFTPAAAIQLKPRIVFEGTVILRRKGWLLNTALIPVQAKNETVAAYFIRLHHWREQHQLPEHVFLFLRSPYIPAVPDKPGKLQRDDYKPQYICFSQPLLVSLFRKLISRAGAYCYLEEMLPHATHLQMPDATVAEYMLHWYKY